jgi:hypothetical protein
MEDRQCGVVSIEFSSSYYDVYVFFKKEFFLLICIQEYLQVRKLCTKKLQPNTSNKILLSIFMVFTHHALLHLNLKLV